MIIDMIGEERIEYLCTLGANDRIQLKRGRGIIVNNLDFEPIRSNFLNLS